MIKRLRVYFYDFWNVNRALRKERALTWLRVCINR